MIAATRRVDDPNHAGVIYARAVHVTNSLPDAAVWWGCDCDTVVELAECETAGVVVACPDCAGPLHELWRWEPVAA